MAYATRADIEEFYGPTEVRKWADRDQDASATKIEANITAALSWATTEIDVQLSNGQTKVPFTGTVPDTIRDICRKLAGAQLYAPRGAQDFDEQGRAVDRLRPVRAECYAKLESIRTGRIILNATLMRDSQPFVVTDDEEEELDPFRVT